MKRRAAHNRHLAVRVLVAVLAVAIVMASGWFLIPIVNHQLQHVGAPSRAVITTDEVNLRSGPGTSFEVLDVVASGTTLSAASETENGFAAVIVDGDHGWIATEYLAEPGVAYAAEHQTEVSVPVSQAPVIQEPVTESLVAGAPVVQVESATGSQEAVVPPVQVTTQAAPAAVSVIAQSTQVEAEPQPGEHWISVDRTQRTVTLYDGEIIVSSFDALIGKDLSVDGYYSTAIGTYYVHVKEKALAETPFAKGVYLTDFVGFDPDRSNGFHSPTRDEFGNVVITGGTATLGCVRLSEQNAGMLFDFAYIGMRVVVHD